MKIILRTLPLASVLVTGVVISFTGALMPESPAEASYAGLDQMKAAIPGPAMFNDVGWQAALLARPVLSRGRRAPALVSNVLTPSLPRLAGIIITPQSKTALFEDYLTGLRKAASEGERIDGTAIRSILADRVVWTDVRSSIVTKLPWSDIAGPVARTQLDIEHSRTSHDGRDLDLMISTIRRRLGMSLSYN